MNTTNYTTLSESVTTKKEALAVANATFCPSVLAERSRLLLFDFITRFFNGDKEKQERLINELYIDNGATIKALLFSIYECIAETSQMLKECQTLKLSEDKADADNTEDSK